MKYLVLVFSMLLVGSSAIAKGKGNKGGGKSSGWNKGGVKVEGWLPKGWEEGKPAGWTKGEKKGWEGADEPPGLEKKEGELPPGLEKKSPVVDKVPVSDGGVEVKVDIKVQGKIGQQEGNVEIKAKAEPETERKSKKERTRHSLD